MTTSTLLALIVTLCIPVIVMTVLWKLFRTADKNVMKTGIGTLCVMLTERLRSIIQKSSQ